MANLSSNDISILIGTGTASFGAPTNFPAGSGPREIVTGDFNGDGKVDLAVANLDVNNVSILMGTGTGNFAAATNFTVGLAPANVAACDFNGDGKFDLAVGNINSNNVSILVNTSSTCSRRRQRQSLVR